jgi:hypothetical protein
MTLIRFVLADQAVGYITMLTILCALADLASGVIAALRAGDFSLAKIAQFLGDHVLIRVIPIVFGALFASSIGFVLNATGGNVVPEGSILRTLPPLLWAATWTGLGAYVLETLASLGVNVKTIQTGVRTATP